MKWGRAYSAGMDDAMEKKGLRSAGGEDKNRRYSLAKLSQSWNSVKKNHVSTWPTLNRSGRSLAASC
jgi:hypothetical protein